MIKVYVESKSHSELWATFETEELYLICLPALEKRAEGLGMTITESEESEVDFAREVLKSKGFQVDNLWSILDVQDNYECDDSTAQEILYGALTNEATMHQIWFAIHEYAEYDGLTRKED